MEGKPKVLITSNVVNLSAGSLSLENIGVVSIKPVMFWKSDIGSVVSSVNGLLDVKNMKNTVAEEMSYAKSDNSANDENMDETTSRKTCIHTYVLGHFLKTLLYNDMSDNNKVLELPSSKFNGSNQLLPFKSCAKKLAVSKKILVNDDVRQINKCTNQKIVVKKILVDFPKLAVESVFSKFGKVVSIKIQLIGLWQKALIKFESLDVASSIAFK
ncbi:hypothetical protein G9A89_013706 [Geosiphon pyriformis]|nr:hypothetical protein G9A89_013706 [Geosiphon pyriformis]